jgi:hypothetical protein
MPGFFSCTPGSSHIDAIPGIAKPADDGQRDMGLTQGDELLFPGALPLT